MPFWKKESPLLLVTVDGTEVCRVNAADIPCELTPVARVAPNGSITFRDSAGVPHIHSLAAFSGWFHISVRVHENLVCQADCVVAESKGDDPATLLAGGATGIRFQPFFLPGAEVGNEQLRGQGLFARGLHFPGSITIGNVLLSCECDACHRSFLVQSFHSGFSNSGYFYSGSGKYTLTLRDDVPGCPAALSVPDPAQLAALETALPKAPDESAFRYLNPLRCPHCSAPYIDFEAHPDQRPAEYYGNYLYGSEPIHYQPDRG